MRYTFLTLGMIGRNTFFSLGFSLISFSCLAQQLSNDKLWLHSGTEIEGKILLPLQGDLLTIIRESGGDTLQLFKQDIARIEQRSTYEVDEFFKIQQAHSSLKVFNKKELYGILQIAGGTGDKGLLGAGIASGYRWKSGLETGLSVHYYGIDEWTDGIIPIGLDVRMPITSSRRGRFSTLIQLNTGFAMSDAREGLNATVLAIVRAGNGFYFQPGLQFRANITRNFGLIWDIAYLRNARPVVNVKTGNTEFWHSQHFLLTRVGFLF